MISRRQFLKAGAVAGAGLLLPWRGMVGTAEAFVQSPGLQKWQTTLRAIRTAGSGAGIPVMAPDGVIGAVTHYTIGISEFTDALHPDLGPTTLWGFGQGDPASLGVYRHLGGLIVAERGVPIQITFRNNLPPTHIIPVDLTIPEANLAQNRTAVHVHGGFVPWISDGGPFDWWTPGGVRGPSFLNNQVLNPGAAANEAEYYYPNDQSARLVWYHDHAVGITRINAYAGIASGYVIRDAFERNLINDGLPDFVERGGNEIPLVIQDKIFVPSNIQAVDPTWPVVMPARVQGLGSLWYAHVYERNRYKLTGPKKQTPDPSVVPEFFGDTMLANGTVYPEVTVEARRYRLRVLNACNARFLNLQLYVDDGSPDGVTLNPATLAPTNAKGPDFLQLGTEGGFLPFPVLVPSNVPFNPLTLGGSLVLGSAERADLIVDFSGYANQHLILYNDAPAPFPVGSPLNDYFPGNPLNPVQPIPGFGPNTRQILRFHVLPASQDPPLNISPATDLRPGNDPLLAPLGVTTPPAGIPIRPLTLNETFDAFGRLIQLLGTNVPPVTRGQGYGRAYMDPATEVVTLGPQGTRREVWQIANLTGDTHPIHFHLVNVQIIARQPFRVSNYNGTPAYIGPARPPHPSEAGWKDTVRMNPGEVTTVIMEFKLPAVPFVVPPSPRTGGNEYVWHCHILEHEEHDMMRPLVVI